jgi:hypothetical protein
MGDPSAGAMEQVALLGPQDMYLDDMRPTRFVAVGPGSSLPFSSSYGRVAVPIGSTTDRLKAPHPMTEVQHEALLQASSDRKTAGYVLVGAGVMAVGVLALVLFSHAL